MSDYEPSVIIHAYGDFCDNDWQKAAQLDQQGGRRKYGRAIRIGDGSEGDYICMACLHVHDRYPCIQAGDEVVARCEECGSLESIERIDPRAAGEESATSLPAGAPAAPKSPEDE